MRKPLIAVLASAATLLAAGAAHAGGNVQWSVGINLPNVATVVSNGPFYSPAPVYYEPAPVYAPAPVIYQAAPRVVYQRPVVIAPQPVYVGRPVVGYGHRGWDSDRDGIPNRYDRVDNRVYGPYGDRDRDGVPNRYDRVDNRQYADRDRDGIPDRRDGRDDRKYRH